MANNHIIVGLGGTGGNIIRAFRTLLWQEHRNKEPRWYSEKENRWSDPVANIGYLYVDSSQKELNESDGTWQCLGESLALNKNERLLIRDADMESTLNNLKLSPGISGWLGEPDLLKTMIQNSKGGQGANQIRRFGRYLFAQSASRFMERINDLVRVITEKSRAEVTFHVCCTLGCGTGSGSVVDAISQIRKAYPHGGTHPIFIYALISDQMVKDNVGFFYANQYACLCELNALRKGKWNPHDVLAFEVKRLEHLRDNFQSCFLISPINEKSEVASKPEQEEMIASYIYQKTVALRNILPRSLHQAESFEDFRAYTAVLEDRATDFGSFGIKRFRIPETEIREKLAFTFAIQSINQILYNNWSDNGYVNIPRNRDLPELVTDPANNQRWCLTDDHLKVSKDFVLAGGKVWPSIEDEWNETLQRRKAFLIEHKSSSEEKDLWLGDIREFAKTHYDSNFRNRGVVLYYDDKRGAILDYAREIRKKVELDLFDRWKTGEDSISETERILDTLLEHLEKRKTTFDHQKTEADKLGKKAMERIADADEKWDKMGILAKKMGKPAQILGDFTAAHVDKYVAETQLAACTFARELVQQVISQLKDTRNNVTKIKALLAKRVEIYQKEVDARIRPAEKINYREKDVRLIEPEQVNKTIKHLETSPRVQEGQAAKVRHEIAGALGANQDEQTFSVFPNKMSAEELDRILFRTSDQGAMAAHANLFAGSQTELRRIIGRNIVEKLYEEYPTVTTDLKQSLEALVQSSVAYMRFNRNEAQLSTLLRTDIPPMPRRTIVIFLPRADHIKGYRDDLKAAFQNAFDDRAVVEIVDSDHNSNEILLICVCFWFELRFIQPLTELYDRYSTFIKAGEWKGVHQIHLENHRAPLVDLPFGPSIGQLPRLNLLTGPVPEALVYRYLLIGAAMDYVRLEENARNIKTLQYVLRDARGIPLSTPVDFGVTTLEEACKRTDWGSFAPMQAELDKELKEKYSHPDKKDALKAKFDDMVAQKYKDTGSKASGPAFVAFREKVTEIEDYISKI